MGRPCLRLRVVWLVRDGVQYLREIEGRCLRGVDYADVLALMDMDCGLYGRARECLEVRQMRRDTGNNPEMI